MHLTNPMCMSQPLAVVKVADQSWGNCTSVLSPKQVVVGPDASVRAAIFSSATPLLCSKPDAPPTARLSNIHLSIHSSVKPFMFKRLSREISIPTGVAGKVMISKKWQFEHYYYRRRPPFPLCSAYRSCAFFIKFEVWERLILIGCAGTVFPCVYGRSSPLTVSTDKRGLCSAVDSGVARGDSTPHPPFASKPFFFTAVKLLLLNIITSL